MLAVDRSGFEDAEHIRNELNGGKESLRMRDHTGVNEEQCVK